MTVRKRWIDWVTRESAAQTKALPWHRAVKRSRRMERSTLPAC